MAHIPINHPLRPFYRALSGLCGLFILAFGIMGAIASAGDDFFARESIWRSGSGPTWRSRCSPSCSAPSWWPAT